MTEINNAGGISPAVTSNQPAGETRKGPAADYLSDKSGTLTAGFPGGTFPQAQTEQLIASALPYLHPPANIAER